MNNLTILMTLIFSSRNGEEWYHFRKAVNPLLSKGLLENYKERQQYVANRFIDYIERQKSDTGTINDVYSHLLKFSIEGTVCSCTLWFIHLSFLLPLINNAFKVECNITFKLIFLGYQKFIIIIYFILCQYNHPLQ